MNDLPSIHARIRKTKKELKELNTIVRDTFAASQSLKNINEDLKELRDKKRRYEAEIKQECADELEKADRLKQSLKADQQLLSDVALTKFMKGETIELTDENDVKYEPVVKISFKKTM
jgi:septal ring factor EnvC (AmiA/AmiB activator)